MPVVSDGKVVQFQHAGTSQRRICQIPPVVSDSLDEPLNGNRVAAIKKRDTQVGTIETIHESQYSKTCRDAGRVGDDTPKCRVFHESTEHAALQHRKTLLRRKPGL